MNEIRNFPEWLRLRGRAVPLEEMDRLDRLARRTQNVYVSGGVGTADESGIGVLVPPFPGCWGLVTGAGPFTGSYTVYEVQDDGDSPPTPIEAAGTMYTLAVEWFSNPNVPVGSIVWMTHGDGEYWRFLAPPSAGGVIAGPVTFSAATVFNDTVTFADSVTFAEVVLPVIAPGTPTAGSVYFSVATHALLVYDGSAYTTLTGAADGKVYVTVNDTVRNYLASTLTAGTGITLTVVNPGSDETLEVATTGPHWVPVTKSHTDLSDASMSHTFTLYSLPAKGVIHAAIVKHSVTFTGGGITNYTVRVEDAGTVPLTSDQNVNLSPSDTTGFSTSPPVASAILPKPFDFGASYNLKLRVATVGANMDQATAGSLTVWLLVSTLP